VISPIYDERQNITYFFDRIKKAPEQLDPGLEVECHRL
jgi:hypothetical protein